MFYQVPMPAARSSAADIDATIARGEWWLSLFEALSRRGERRRDALTQSRGGLARGFSRAVDRATRGVRLALIAVLRLEQILKVLADLRRRSVEEIAAIRARALARANSRSAAEQDRVEQHRFKRDAPDREPPDREPRGSLVDALDRRLAAVDPILVDFDDLGLRETVLRICADTGVTPDWDRWEAGDWAALETPCTSAPAAAVPVPAPAPSVLKAPVLPGLPGFVPRPEVTAAVRLFQAERDAERWRPRLE